MSQTPPLCLAHAARGVQPSMAVQLKDAAVRSLLRKGNTEVKSDLEEQHFEESADVSNSTEDKDYVEEPDDGTVLYGEDAMQEKSTINTNIVSEESADDDEDSEDEEDPGEKERD